MDNAVIPALPHLGVLAVDGPDASTFLQGQATCDCRQLAADRGALGALCNLQGRMIVSFYVIAVADGLRLVMPRDRVPAVLTHLKKFSVFSRVSLRDDSAAYLLFDAGNEASAADAPGADASGFAVMTQNGIHTLVLRSHRALGCAPAAAFATAATVDGSAAWRAAAIRAGELLVDTANADKFLPQALNYDVIDGVSFRKGCYTGQEVVARMHFKGKMKERLYVLQAGVAATVPTGTAIIDAGGNKVGEVVDAAASDGMCHIAAIVRHDAMQAGSLRLGDDNHTPLAAAVAPYPIPAANPA